MRSTATICCMLAACLAPAPALAFTEAGGEGYTFAARGAVDLSATFMGNNGPRVLYPEASEGFGGAGLRLLMTATAADHLRIDFNGYQDMLASTTARSFGAPASPTAYRTTYLDYDWGSPDGKIRAPLAVDVLSARLFFGPADLTVGRQPVGLGSNFIFTPNDLFHPFAAGAVDTAFRPGVDAARLDWRVGSLGAVTVLGALGYHIDDRPRWRDSAVLARASVNAAGFDWSVLGGKVNERSLAGGAISGELKSLGRIGVRCEGNVSFPQAQGAGPYVQVAAGVDRKWENSLHLIAEYYFHGNGGTDTLGYLASLGGRDLTVDPYLGRHYLGAMLSGQPIPLVHMQGAVVANLTDPSVYVIPAIVYNAADEVDLIVFGTVPVGRTPATTGGFTELNSEFGVYPYSLLLLTRMYF